MGRKPRLHVAGGLYHIITRGNNRKEIFREDRDYSAFLSALREIKEKKPFKLYAYCLMPNHFHLLMEVGSVSTSIIMQRLLTVYTKYYNRKYRKVGHLLQGRYKSIICEKDSYLLELVRYIHLNPYRAGLVKQPADWSWSGHKEYLGYDKSRIVENQEVLGMLSNDLKQAIVKYQEFVRDGSRSGKIKEYYPKEKTPYLGSDKFKDDLMVRHTDLICKNIVEPSVRKKSTLNEIVDDVAKMLNVSVESIRGKVRIKALAEARKQVIKKAVGSGFRGIEIARYLNCSEGYITKLFTQN